MVSTAAGRSVALSVRSAALCLLLWVGSAQEPAPFAERFDAGWTDAWTEQQLGGARTSYDVVDDDTGSVLRAVGHAAATALYRPVHEIPEIAGRVAWRWKVQRSLSGVPDERSRDGDDFAARLFVIFGSGRFDRSARALCYVWAGKLPSGSSFRSPYATDVATIVLQSGDEAAGRWIRERRDVFDDYRRIFGADPPPPSAIAVMVDTDNTGAQATAWYDDVVLW